MFIAKGAWAVALCCLAAASCSGEARQSTEPRRAAVAVPSNNASHDTRPKIVVFGDSLTAGLGLQPSESYPADLQQKLAGAGYAWDVVNAGESGDTTAAGLDRLDWALDEPGVKILVLELGANDGLRGLPPSEMEKNLAAMIERAQSRGIAVLLAGMEAPPNYGPDYTSAFHRVYPDLARKYHVPLIPFLLDNVAGIPSLNQADGIHPTAAGARIVADTVWRGLRPLVDAAPAS
jgi:acyl-CoA thioesterase-1